MFKKKIKKEEVFNPRKPKKCPICGKTFETWGNNPEPIISGLCCDDCNYKYVLPFRRFLANDDKYLFIPTDSNIKIFRFNYENEDLAKVYLICKHLGINEEELSIYKYKDLTFYYSNNKKELVNHLASIVGNKILKGDVIIEKKGETNV